MRWNAKGAALLVLMVVSGQGCQPAQPQHATLIEAVECGDRLDARRHLKREADVNQPGEKGWTALMVAAYQGDLSMVKMLWKSGADLHATNAAGATPLMVATYNGHAHVARYLLTQGADVNDRTPEGRTPLMIAARSGNFRLIQVLVEMGADIRMQDGQGRTVFSELEHNALVSGVNRKDIQEYLDGHGGQLAQPVGNDGRDRRPDGAQMKAGLGKNAT